MPLYRKKPVVIEARQWDGTREDWLLICEELDPGPRESGPTRLDYVRTENGFRAYVSTLEGQLNAQPGDWIIRGVKGEFYPCKPDIFATTYEPA